LLLFFVANTKSSRMANLLDQDDSFPENPFDNPSQSLEDNTQNQDGFNNSPVITDAPSSNPSMSPSSLNPSIAEMFSPEPERSSPFATEKPSITGILSGDNLFAVPRATDNDDKLRVWQEKHSQDLIKKAEESRIKTEEQKKKAQAELAEIYNRREELVRNRETENRQAEKAFIGKRDEIERVDNRWERVRNYVDIKGTEKVVDAKDTARMRSVLIKMWNK